MTKLLTTLMVLTVTFGCKNDPPEAPKQLSFKNRGQKTSLMSLANLKSAVAPVEIEVWEPHERKKVTYRGFPIRSLLDQAYGEKWKKTEELLFTCSDGYQPSLPVERFLKYDGYLVFERKGDASFRVQNKDQNETVHLGPFYLIWDNINAPELKKDGGSGWPYQVTTVDLIQFLDRFPNMAPPINASLTVKKGFIHYRKHCMTCHTINGEGGAKSVELNYPTNVTEYFKPGMLKKWILQPTSFRYNTTMPPIAPDHSDRVEITESILAYLEVMAKNKRAPKKE